ncbi:MAG TPA: hypothetical protein VIK12_01275 [Pengzhenrongella sp.]
MSVPEPNPDSSTERTTGRNRPATVGLILGIVCLAVNPVLLVGFGAIIVSAVGLNRASLMGQFGYAQVGKRAALAGIVLGLLGIIESVVLKDSRF